MAQVKKLYRSADNKMIAGVCGGLAEYLETDPTVIRLVTVLLLILTGLFPLTFIYLAWWIIVPEKPPK
jgi:phage shock protein C